MPKELILLYVALLTVQLYIQLEQFITVQVTLPTIYHHLPSNCMLVFKNLHLNLFNIVTLLTLKVVLGYHHTRLTPILTIFKSKCFNINTHRDKNICVPTVSRISKQTLSQLIHQSFCHVYITRLKLMARKGLLEVLP